MPKNPSSKSVPPKAVAANKRSGTVQPATAGAWLRVLLHLLGVLLLVGGLAFLTIQSKKYIEAETAGPIGPLHIALLNKPVWMSDFLAEQIAATVPSNSSSAFDHNLLVATVEKLKANPWVAKVNQVRRIYGQQPGDTLEVDCDFRAPIALVHWDNSYWLVDNEGVVLPEKFSAENLEKITVGRDGRTCFRIVQGVHMAPPGCGKKWLGADLAAGLDLVKLFDGKLYLDEVTAINVSNYGGRVRRADPQITLETRYKTEIWWGRPINAKDAFVEAKAARKLEILRAVVKQDGRIDANHAYVDVRYDDPLVPTTQPTEARTVDDPNR